MEELSDPENDMVILGIDRCEISAPALNFPIIEGYML
jgi:hypothetical protein